LPTKKKYRQDKQERKPTKDLDRIYRMNRKINGQDKQAGSVHPCTSDGLDYSMAT
jgi:hypothetical protein